MSEQSVLQTGLGKGKGRAEVATCCSDFQSPHNNDDVQATYVAGPSKELWEILCTGPADQVYTPALENILLWASLRQHEFRLPEPLKVVEEGIIESQVNTVEDVAVTNSEIQPPSQDSHIEAENKAESVNGRDLVKPLSRLARLAQGLASKLTTPAAPEPPTTSIAVINPVVFGECISCFDEHPKGNLVTTPCNHEYCKECMQTLVVNAMKTESAFPPKCCLDPIPFKTFWTCLDAEQRKLYKEKSAEYALPTDSRWYCPTPQCARWIPPNKLKKAHRGKHECPHCQTAICSICRAVAHDGQEACPEDFGLVATLDLAQAEGWTRCYNCRTMVELTTGCRHITCKCGSEFCYVCSARWRTCRCSEADAARRREELRNQRTERAVRQAEEERRQREENEAAMAELRELEEAIRLIEELERQEAEERAAVEQARKEEEDRQLARLEEERITEEARRQEEQRQLEQQILEMLLTSCVEECSELQHKLEEIIRFQRTALRAKHEAEANGLEYEHILKKDEARQLAQGKIMELQADAQQKLDILFTQHEQEWQKMLLELDLEEDDMFMNIQVHLRGKPNREAREARLRQAFEERQFERKQDLTSAHERERTAAIEKIQLDHIEAQRQVQMDCTTDEQHLTAQNQLESRMPYDRAWVELIHTRRLAMLHEHERIMLEEIRNEQEPVGLTEDLARNIEPQLDGGPCQPITHELPAVSVETTDMYSADNVETIQRPILQLQTPKVPQHQAPLPPTPPPSGGLLSPAAFIEEPTKDDAGVSPVSATRASKPDTFPLTPRSSRGSTSMHTAQKALPATPEKPTTVPIMSRSRPKAQKFLANHEPISLHQAVSEFNADAIEPVAGKASQRPSFAPKPDITFDSMLAQQAVHESCSNSTNIRDALLSASSAWNVVAQPSLSTSKSTGRKGSSNSLATNAASVSSEGSGKQKEASKRRSIFGFKKASLSEEEIKKRMVGAVGSAF